MEGNLWLYRLYFRVVILLWLPVSLSAVDLPNGAKSGLKDCIKILKNIDDIGTCFFDEKDVVRHRLVQDIIKAYAKFENTDINNLRNNGSKN